MPKAWSAKDERQYQHVKSSEKKRGRSTDVAEEIAARTVNKQRREEGRTPNKRTQGTGNPNRPLDELSRDELYNRAKEMQVAGRSRMTKAELASALGGSKARRTRAATRAVPRTHRRVTRHHAEAVEPRHSGEPAVITMHQFIEAHGISGDAMPAADNPLDAPVAGARHYRVTLRRDGRSFETYSSRPPGAEPPTVEEALAEVARRASTGADGADASSALGTQRDAEAGRLHEFLGMPAAQELLFEFGHRPAGQIQDGDPTGSPARPEEMTNQEPGVLAEAARAAKPSLSAPMVLAVLPPVSLAAGAALFARGKYRASALSMAAGVTTAVAGARASQWLSHVRQGRAQERELKRLADEHDAIQAGR